MPHLLDIPTLTPTRMPHCQSSEGYTPGARDVSHPDYVQPISTIPGTQPSQLYGHGVPGVMGRPQAVVASPPYSCGGDGGSF